ncbi:hypothetical protein TNCV_3359331 [Trichonephila clavipes]|nr:hypothetical protein TNCV_3359331 [Trichonephila clavipes]
MTQPVLKKQKLRRRVIGKGLRVYLETRAYYSIRKFVDKEKLEAFTYQLNEEKELKAVIRGNHTANFTGCPRNPLNKPPPRVNFWEERAPKPREIQEAAKADASKQATAPPAPAPEQTAPPVSPVPAPRASPSTTPQARQPFTPQNREQPQINSPKPPFSQTSNLSETINQLRDQKVVELFQMLCSSRDQSTSQPRIQHPNYTTFRNDRLTHREGTVILVKNSIAHHSIRIHTATTEITGIALEGQLDT